MPDEKVKLISSLQHPIVKRMVKLRRDKGLRHAEKRLVLSSQKIIDELDQPIRIALVGPGGKAPDADEIYHVPAQIIEKVSGLKSADDLVVEVDMPQPTTLDKCRRILALDGVRDPGNLGTLIRTALALGWDGLFLLRDSADPFNDKALRAGRGAIFRLPYCQGTTDELVALNLPGYVADLQGTPYKQATLHDKMVLILGNEANGPSHEVVTAFQPITIPMSGPMESLNVSVAGAILLSIFCDSSSS